MQDGKKICGQHASIRYTWPGHNEAVVCVEHAQKLEAAAQAMGFQLQLIPIAYSVNDPIPEEFPTCAQIVDA